MAFEVEPSVSLDCAADFNVNNINLFRGIAEVNNDLSVSLGAALSGYFIWDAFSRLHDKDYKDRDFMELTLASVSFPLFPVIDKESVEVTKKDSGGKLSFSGSYKLSNPGLLSRFNTFVPCANIYKGSERVNHLESKSQIKYQGDNQFSFDIAGVSEDAAFIFNPCIIAFNNMSYEADGVPFSSMTPTAAITDIVQTSSEFSPSNFYHRGWFYDYRYNFYIKQYLIGANYCTEWGIYSPTSDDIYNPNELKDGSTIQYWTAYSDSPTSTFEYTPYVKLLDGSITYYESKTHTLKYNQLLSTKSSLVPNSDSRVSFQLDSVVVDGKRIY